jgi:hypothetical protein
VRYRTFTENFDCRTATAQGKRRPQWLQRSKQLQEVARSSKEFQQAENERKYWRAAIQK